MKNKSQNVFYVVFLLALIGALLTYLYAYQPNNEKTETLRASNDTLEARVQELKVFYDEMPQNIEEIKKSKADIISKVTEFPQDVKEEDIIYVALKAANIRDEQGNPVEDPELYFPVVYENLKVGDKEEFANIPADVVKAAAVEELQMKDSEGNVIDCDMVFNSRVASYIHVTDYDTMKRMIDRVNKSEGKLAISNMSYTINQDGMLDGNLEVTFYSVKGTSIQYVPKKFKDYELGAFNLFRVGEIVIPESTGSDDDADADADANVDDADADAEAEAE